MKRIVGSLVPILLLVASACGGNGDATATATSTATVSPTATSTAGGTPTATPPPAGEQAVCLQAASYAGNGDIQIVGDTSGALVSGQVIDIRWDAHEGCERRSGSVSTSHAR
ncbi:MAG: hypothetical protein O3B31_05205 [Chloroflexi bacterium]|nr:hypothetical protein [Chloroflexota bacterium]MDA1002733.1 hypothetical protein [Chloroflexota bacterium]